MLAEPPLEAAAVEETKTSPDSESEEELVCGDVTPVDSEAETGELTVLVSEAKDQSKEPPTQALEVPRSAEKGSGDELNLTEWHNTVGFGQRKVLFVAANSGEEAFLSCVEMMLRGRRYCISDVPIFRMYVTAMGEPLPAQAPVVAAATGDAVGGGRAEDGEEKVDESGKKKKKKTKKKTTGKKVTTPKKKSRKCATPVSKSKKKKKKTMRSKTPTVRRKRVHSDRLFVEPLISSSRSVDGDSRTLGALADDSDDEEEEDDIGSISLSVSAEKLKLRKAKGKSKGSKDAMSKTPSGARTPSLMAPPRSKKTGRVKGFRRTQSASVVVKRTGDEAGAELSDWKPPPKDWGHVDHSHSFLEEKIGDYGDLLWKDPRFRKHKRSRTGGLTDYGGCKCGGSCKCGRCHCRGGDGKCKCASKLKKKKKKQKKSVKKCAKCGGQCTCGGCKCQGGGGRCKCGERVRAKTAEDFDSAHGTKTVKPTVGKLDMSQWGFLEHVSLTMYNTGRLKVGSRDDLDASRLKSAGSSRGAADDLKKSKSAAAISSSTAVKSKPKPKRGERAKGRSITVTAPISESKKGASAKRRTGSRSPRSPRSPKGSTKKGAAKKGARTRTRTAQF